MAYREMVAAQFARAVIRPLPLSSFGFASDFGIRISSFASNMFLQWPRNDATQTEGGTQMNWIKGSLRCGGLVFAVAAFLLAGCVSQPGMTAAIHLRPKGATA